MFRKILLKRILSFFTALHSGDHSPQLPRGDGGSVSEWCQRGHLHLPPHCPLSALENPLGSGVDFPLSDGGGVDVHEGESGLAVIKRPYWQVREEFTFFRWIHSRVLYQHSTLSQWGIVYCYNIIRLITRKWKKWCIQNEKIILKHKKTALVVRLYFLFHKKIRYLDKTYI